MSFQEFEEEDPKEQQKRLFIKIGVPLLIIGIALCLICFSLMPPEEASEPFWAVFGISSFLIFILGILFIILRYHTGDWDQTDIPD